MLKNQQYQTNSVQSLIKMYYILLIGLCQAIVQPNVNLTIGMNILDQSSHDFINKFKQYSESFRLKGLQIHLRHYLWPCYTCESRHNFTQIEKNCFGGGKYCQYSENIPGQFILREIIRQQCILENKPNIFFDYLNLFNKECSHNNKLNECAISQLNTFNLTSSYFDSCFNSSFIDGEQSQLQLKSNKILDQFKNQQYNQTTFTLYLDQEDITQDKFDIVLNKICYKFEFDPPQFCGIIKKEQIERENILETLFIIIFFVLIFSLAITAGWNLFSKLKNSSNIVFDNKIKITIPKDEKDHIPLDDDL